MAEKYTEIKECNRHIYLYAKGWYKKHSPWDLAILLGERNLIDPTDVTIGDIIEQLSSMVFQSMEDSSDFLRFVSTLSPKNCWKVGIPEEHYEFNLVVIRSCLSILKFTTTGPQIGKPDSKILPLKEK